jgi:hypothetical protein
MQIFIGTVLGALFTIAITVVVEFLRAPKLELSLDEDGPPDVRSEEGSPLNGDDPSGFALLTKPCQDHAG